jgi:hypothetical protein
MLKYGQSDPPENDLESIQGVNVGIIAGSSDMLSTLDDTRYVKDKLKKTLVHYSEHPLGHLSYFTAKNMSYF